MKAPVSNPLDPAKVALGRRLFFDTRLSLDERFSCSTCHDPAHGFSEARRVSVGVLGRQGKRHTPTLLGRTFGKSQFWDGRTATLEEQVLQPIIAPDEMGMTMEDVLQRLHQDAAYRGLTRESLADALASYVRTLHSEDSRFDRFLSGQPDGLSDLELEGLRLFQDKAQCYLCHSGPQFTDEGFHNTGVAWHESALQDEGRAAITGKLYHQGAFKTPTLREAVRRGPYMHDGSLATLEDVIEFYDRGGNPNPHLDENIVPLHLSDAEKKALVAFVRTGLAGSVTAENKTHHGGTESRRKTRPSKYRTTSPPPKGV
ncbi:MAG TPA: cytochrome c peroxidase [Candidatus Saccharimonadales bacterium]|jgi:cytochrome c peroxidase|nr:cytochrome c peroxidase [Candidatus Saccharimonadales bacterium]